MRADCEPISEHQHTGGRRFDIWLEVGTLLLLAAFLAYSFFADRLRWFLAPSYIWLSPVTALLLLLMFAARLRAYFRRAVSCDCATATTWQIPTSVCAAILLLPLVSAVVVNPEQLSPEGARKRRVDPPPRNVELERAVNWVLGLKTKEKKKAAGPVALPKNPTILDLLDAAGTFHPDDLEGQVVTVIGQCDLPSGATSRRFDLYRLVVTCCIADASTLPLEIARTSNNKLEPGGWVRIRGSIKFDNPMDPSLPVVHALIIDKIAAPSEPYL